MNQKLQKAMLSIMRCGCDKNLDQDEIRAEGDSGHGVGLHLDKIDDVDVPLSAVHYRGMESGLLLFETLSIGLTTVIANTTFPLSIFAGEDLQSYVSAGSALPGYAETRWLFWGNRTGDPAGACLPWPTSFSLGSEDEYTSEGFTSAVVLESTQGHIIDPCWFTGKTKFAAQCKLNAGMSIGSLAPASWSTGLRTGISCNLGLSDGIFHDGNYNYWLIRIDSSGCKAIKLNIPSLWSGMECIRTWLVAGSISDAEDKVRLEGYILAVLEPVLGSEITVLSSAQVQDIYSDGKTPWAPHGWKFSRQVSGDTEASVVVYHQSPTSTGGNYYARCYLWTIDFTVSTSTVTAIATLIEEDDFYPTPGDDYIFTHLLGVACWWNALSTGYTPKGDDVAFYCFYTSSDVLEIVRYRVSTPVADQTGNMNPGPPGCGESWSNAQYTYRSASIGGYHFDVNVGANAMTATSASGYVQILTDYVNLIEGAEFDAGCLRIGGYSCGSCCRTFSTGGTVPCAGWNAMPGSIGECVHYYGLGGSAEGAREITKRYIMSSEKYSIIPYDDAESVFVTEVLHWGSGSTEDHYTTGKDDMVLGFRAEEVTGGWTYTDSLNISTNASSAGLTDCDGLVHSIYTGGWALVDSSSGSGDSVSANIVSAHGVINLDESDIDAWEGLAQDVSVLVPCHSYAMACQQSYNHGDTAYHTNPPTSPATDRVDVTGDYGADPDDLIDKVKRFIGYA